MTDLANRPPADLAATQNQGPGQMLAVASTRAAQEVQAAMVVAKRFPRDTVSAFNRIIQACRRPGLAEQALYAYPKGNTTVTGPSIRLAEALAQNWGNLDFGIIELEQHKTESVVMAYAWDLETNTRQTKVFTVPHVRHTRQGDYALTDPRDVYELVANNGARRLRACILGVIPGDITEAAISEAEKTLAGQTKDPLIDRARKAAAMFAEIGVDQPALERRLGHRLDVISETEIVGLRKIFAAIRDNMASPADYFPPEPINNSAGQPADPDESHADALARKLRGGKNKAAPAPEPEAPPQDQPKAPE